MKTQKCHAISFIILGILLQACSSKVLDKASDTVDKAEAHTLIRDWKRVIRYDCQSNVVSDKVETIRSPTEYVAIAPKSSVNFYSSYFQNLTNGSSPGLIYGDYNFTIDMAPTTFNMKVEEGVNQINYDFKYCDHRQLDPNGHPTSECATTPYTKETGSLFIKVTYIQNWLEGFDEVRPSYSECHPTTTTTTIPALAP